VFGAGVDHRPIPVGGFHVGRFDGGDSHTDRGWLAHDSGELDRSVSLAPRTRRALAGTGIGVPPFESYVDQLVAFAREHPEVGDGAMT